MADNRLVSNEVYFANFEGNTDITQSTDPAVMAEYQRALDNGLGYYQFVTLDEMINNYMATEIMDGSAVEKAKRRQVEFHMQRAIQELSYDVLRARGTLEYQLDGSRLSIPVPQDLVDVIRVNWVDEQGNYHPARPRRFSGNPTGYVQDDQGDFVYDNTGDLTEDTGSEALRRHNEATSDNDITDRYYSGYFGENFFEGYGPYGDNAGRRFGSEPEQFHLNSSYVYMQDQGIIYVSSSLANSFIVVEYISDGLKQNYAEVKVHKKAEQAVYDYTTWMLIRNRTDINFNQKQLAEQTWYTSKRRTKHRLSPIDPNQVFGVLRQQSKNIKH